MSSSSATIEAVAMSRVVSAPSKTFVRSVMIAGPPVTWACRPSGRSAAAVVRISVTFGPTLASSLVSTGTATTATVPSSEYDRGRGLAADRERGERRGAGRDRRLVVSRQRCAVGRG